MKKSKFTQSQILSALRQHAGGRNPDEICRELGINRQTLYNWRKKYGDLEAAELKRLKELEEENSRLKHMYAELSLDYRFLKEVIEKSFPGFVRGLK